MLPATSLKVQAVPEASHPYIRQSFGSLLQKRTSFLSDADWFSPDRAAAWSRVLAVLLAVRVLVWLIKPQGSDPIAADFVCYWVAAGFAAAGHAVLAYDPAALSQAEHVALAMPADAFFGFYYPPGYLLLLLPLALLPYVAALLAFLAAGFLPFLASVRVLLPQRWALVPMLSFPGVVVTAGTGQNGFLSAACFGGYAVFLDRRPFVAGTCLGLLSCKPHLALCVPVALLAARRWQAFLGTATSAIGLAAASWLVLGTAPWLGFLHALPLASDMLTHKLLDAAKLQSAFGAFRIMHLPVWCGWLVQGLVSLTALLALAAAAWRRPGGHAEGALLAAAALVASPYSVDYDLAILGLPLAWLLADARHTGFYRWEKMILLAAYLLPIVSHGVAESLRVPTAPFVLCAVLVLVVRRTLVPAPVPA
jgi:hypothetical protein